MGEGFLMAKKIICESCGTIFPFYRVKDMERCPVCNTSFDEEDDDGIGNGNVAQVEMDESEDGVMYFDEIMIFENEPEYNHVCVYCGECGKDNSLEVDKFDKLIDKEYVILKKGVTVKCSCGKEHKPRKIRYKLKDHYVSVLKHCPVCNSVMVKKIKTSSKFLAAAALGAFAMPYNSKTFECQDCGYRF